MSLCIALVRRRSRCCTAWFRPSWSPSSRRPARRRWPCRRMWRRSCGHFCAAVCWPAASGGHRCVACGFDRLVPFSCKGRGVCSSCGGRRMNETAAEQVARLWPEVPVRQWVLSLPWALRLPVARDPVLLTKVARIFFEAVRAHLRAKVAVGEGTGDEGARREIGAVTFVHRLGSSLNLNPHMHVLVAGGVFLCREDGSTPRFVPTPAPTRSERSPGAAGGGGAGRADTHRARRRRARCPARRGGGPGALCAGRRGG